MGTIADKLDYLADTKEMLKDRLNSLGAEIIESTTFRNYLNWLDTFYEEVSDKTDLSENGVVGRTSQATVVLPTGYTQVDYIESSGTQYIDTGMQANGNTTDYNIVFAPTRITDYNFILSARINAGERRLDIGWGRSGDIYIGYNNASLVNSALYGALTVNTICNIQKSGTNFYLNGTNIYTISAVNFTTPVNLMIFANNNNGTLTNYAGARLYSLKLYENDTLVRNFVPCYRNSDNEVGLYDIVNNVFYTNQGTGVFAYGSVVSIPNPDYPQEINNLSGDIEYKVRGKNLVDVSNLSNVLITPSTGVETESQSWRATDYNDSLKPNTTYCVSWVSSNNYFQVGVIYYDENKNYLSGESLTTSGAYEKTFITPSNFKYYRITYSVSVSGSSVTRNLIQIEQNTTRTSYEPYISESFPLSLGDIELCAISDYKDRIYSQNGEFYLEKNTDKVVLDGSESITTTTYSASAYFHNIRNIGMNGTNNDYAMSNYYTYSSSYMNNTCETANGGKELVTRDNFDQSTYITWLGTNKPIFYYILATPTTTKITEENYPTLYSQLLAIQEFLTKYKINKEFLLDYSSPEIEY